MITQYSTQYTSMVIKMRGRFPWPADQGRLNRPLVSLVVSLPLIGTLVFPPSIYADIPAQLRAPMTSRDEGVAQAIARDLSLLSGNRAVQDGGNRTEQEGDLASEALDAETLGKMVIRAIPEVVPPLSSDILQTTFQGTIAVYEESLDNLTIATMVERFARQLNSARSKIGFVLVSTSGKSESEIAAKVYRDSKGLVNLSGTFRATLVEGEVNALNPLSVVAALEEKRLPPLVELVAPLEIVVAYRRPGIELYGWLVSRNPQEGEAGIANGAPALRELVELLGLGEKERASLLRDGGRSFMVNIQRYEEDFEAFDFSYREGRKSD